MWCNEWEWPIIHCCVIDSFFVAVTLFSRFLKPLDNVFVIPVLFLGHMLCLLNMHFTRFWSWCLNDLFLFCISFDIIVISKRLHPYLYFHISSACWQFWGILLLLVSIVVSLWFCISFDVICDGQNPQGWVYQAIVQDDLDFGETRWWFLVASVFQIPAVFVTEAHN